MTQLRWTTPEGFAFELPLAGLGTRCLAWIVDEAIILAGLQCLSVALHAFAAWLPGLVSALGIISAFVVSLLYAAALEWLWQGQTLGKRLFGLRVMDAEGRPLAGVQVLARNLLRVLDGLPVFYLVGGSSCLATRHQQRLGDLLAGTVVAHPEALAAPDLAPWLQQKYNSFRELPHLALRLRNQATPAEAGAVLEALLRRDQLDPAARAALYRDLVAHFQSRVPFPPEITDALSPEQYLRNLVGILYPRQFSPETLTGRDRR